MSRVSLHHPLRKPSRARQFDASPAPQARPSPPVGGRRGAQMNDGPSRRHATGMPTEALIPRKNDVLAEICRAIARSADHQDVVQECAVRLQRYFGTHAVAMFFEREGEMVLVGFALPAHLDYLESEVRARWASAPPDEERPSVQVMRLRRVVRWNASDPTLPRSTRDLLSMGSAGGLIAVPIYADGNPIGACMVATPVGQPLNAADECLLEDALGIVGIVYRRGAHGARALDQQRRAVQAHDAVVTELAAGVAHEINTPLSTIVRFCEILLQSGLPADARASVQAIMDEALRAATTVRSLQTFARDHAGEIEGENRGRLPVPPLSIL